MSFNNKIMKKLTPLKILLSIVVFSNLISCNKAEKIGCTDSVALNYDSQAISLPGSDQAHCIYDTNCLNVISIAFGDTVNFPLDVYQIDTALLINNTLNIKVSYSGGCENHNFKLYTEGNFCGTPPCNINLKLSHNSNGDLCNAYLSEELCFDISTYISPETYFSLFNPQDSTTIDLN